MAKSRTLGSVEHKTFFMEERKKKLQLLKKNAPKVFQDVANHNRFKINSELETLRMKYKEAETPAEKSQIQARAETLKAELALYQL